MRPGQIQPEARRAGQQAGNVSPAAQQIVDEFPPRRHLLTDHGPPRLRVSGGQRGDRVIECRECLLPRRGHRSRIGAGGHRGKHAP